MSTKLKEFWREHGQKVLIVLALVLTAAVSFRAGQTDEKTEKSAEINVSLNQSAAANPKQKKLLALEGAAKRKGVDVVVAGENDEKNVTSGIQKNVPWLAQKTRINITSQHADGLSK